MDELAKGSYGVVYHGTVEGQAMAVKMEEFSDGVEEQVNLLVELTMLQSFPHERMVRPLLLRLHSHTAQRVH
jgi:hypothetical protein